MVAIVVHNDELAEVLEVNASNKLDLKTDNSGNVKFSKGANGLKGEVTVPTLPTALASGPYLDGNAIKFPTTTGGEETVTLPAVPVDITVDNITFTDDGKLKVTLTNGQEKETPFNSKLVIDAIVNATAEQKGQLKTALIALLKGEELQNLAGETKGYLIATA